MPLSTTHLLREILLAGQARTQSEIQHAFERQGIVISQSKISRLLHQIGAVKLVDNKGKTQYKLPHEAGLIHELTSLQEKSFIRQWIMHIDANDTMIVVHTTPGAASMVARMIDQHRIDLDILGCIAGDDTIFIAPKDSQHIKKIKEQIEQLFHL